jgi:hypothetical protein
VIAGAAALEGICGNRLQLHTFRLAYPAITGLQNPGGNFLFLSGVAALHKIAQRFYNLARSLFFWPDLLCSDS